MLLERDGDVFILTLGETENRFNADFVTQYTVALQTVASASGARALVTTATGKFFSNGLDLDWMQSGTGESFDTFVPRVHRLFALTLAAPFVTVAALQGHAYAAGAMLALAHDARFMRADRGFFCLPEVDIRIPFTPAMASLVQAKVAQPHAHHAMAFGRRYTAPDATAAGLVDDAVELPELLPRAVSYASALAQKDPVTLTAIKRTMYAKTLELLEMQE